jgi:hypothetical protein
MAPEAATFRQVSLRVPDKAKCKVVETGAVEQDEAFKLKAAEAKARKLGGVHKLTQEDIKGLTYEQIKQLRGY